MFARPRRTYKVLPILAAATAFAAMIPMSAPAHTSNPKLIPAGSEIVRAVDPAQTDCATPSNGNAWPAATAKMQNPCDVRALFDQPLDLTKSGIELKDGGGVPVPGSVDSGNFQSGTSAGTVLTNLDGKDTLIFKPSAALAAGKYTAKAWGTGIDAHDASSGATTNVITWSFEVAPAPVTPTVEKAIDSNGDDTLPGGTLDERFVRLEGQAEPLAAIVVKNGATVLSFGEHDQADALGNWHTDVAVPAGAVTLTIESSSVPRTTAERAWAAYEACVAATETGLVAEVDEILVEEECGAAPAAAVPPTASGTASFTVSVPEDSTAPSSGFFTGIGAIQGVSEAITGFTTDNDEVQSLTFSVTNVLGAPVGYNVVCTGCGTARATWELKVDDIGGLYTIKAIAKDASGNEESSGPTINVVLLPLL